MFVCTFLHITGEKVDLGGPNKVKMRSKKKIWINWRTTIDPYALEMVYILMLFCQLFTQTKKIKVKKSHSTPFLAPTSDALIMIIKYNPMQTELRNQSKNGFVISCYYLLHLLFHFRWRLPFLYDDTIDISMMR